MRPLLAFIAPLIACLVASAQPDAAPPPIRAALLAWEPVPARPDVRRVASDLVVLAQAELSDTPGVAWIERAELDRILAENDLALSGRLDPRASLRMGKLARAQIIVAGRLDAADSSGTTLSLDAIDLARGDLLASSTTPLPPRPHKHFSLREEDRTAAVAALRSLLAEALGRHRDIAPKPALALLFLANAGSSSRLVPAAERVAESLRSSASAAGARVLRFPRTSDSRAEQDLALLGLSEADPEAWRGVADLYVWGEYKEIPEEGVPFEQTRVEASLTLWDGVAAPRSIPWSGTAAAFHEASAVFFEALGPALGAKSASVAGANAEAAKLLKRQAASLEAAHRDALTKPGFWTSEAGKAYHSHQLHLLQTASFLDPASKFLRGKLAAIRWSSPAGPVRDLSPDLLWARYADLVALDALSFASTSAPASGGDSLRSFAIKRRIEALHDLIGALGRALPREGRILRPDLMHAADLWAREVNAYAATLRNDSGPTDFLAKIAKADAVDGSFIDASEVGAGVLHRMIDEAWPALALEFGSMHRSNPAAASRVAEFIVATYRLLGREDIAYSRLNAAIAAPGKQSDPENNMPHLRQASEIFLKNVRLLAESNQPPLRLQSHGVHSSADAVTLDLVLEAPFGTSEPERRRISAAYSKRLAEACPQLRLASLQVVASASPSAGDPAPYSPDWSAATSPPIRTDLDRPLPLTPRPLHAFPLASRAAAEITFRARTTWMPPNHRLKAPDAVRLLGWDQDHLWIDGLPVDGAFSPELPALRIVARAPYSRAFHRLGDLLGDGSRGIGVVFVENTAYLATEFDGLWKLGPGAGEVTRITPAEGLPSLRLASLALCPRGLVVAAAPPERAIARLDLASGSWISIVPPPHPAPAAPTNMPGQPTLLAAAGPWLLVGAEQPSLLNVETGGWSEAFERIKSQGAEQRKRSEEETLRRIRQSDPGTPIASLLAEARKKSRHWSLLPPSAIAADADTFWLGGEYGLVHLDPARPAEARLEPCPPVLALSDAGPWLWVAFAPPPETAPPKDLGQGDYSPKQPHEAPYPFDERPEWRRSRLALYDKTARRWLGSVEVNAGITRLASAPGRLWAAGTDLLEFDTAGLAPPRPAPDTHYAPSFTTAWAGLPSATLHRAASLGDHEGLARLLATNPDAVSARLADSAWSPLHAAAAAGDAEASSHLLAAGFAVDALTAEGLSPLGLAAASGELPAIRLLLSAGAEPSRQRHPRRAARFSLDENTLQRTKESPPQPSYSSAEVLADGRVRIRWTIDPGPFSGFIIYRLKDGETPPAYLARGKDETWKYIGQFAASLGSAEREWIDDLGRTADAACTYTVIAVNAHDRDGPRIPVPAGTVPPAPAQTASLPVLLNFSPARLDPTPLHLAASADRGPAVAALLAAGADPAAIDLGGYTPMLLAASQGRTAAAHALLAAGSPSINAFVQSFTLPDREGIDGFQERPRSPRVRYPSAPRRWSALAFVYEAHADKTLFENLLAAGADPLLGPDGPLAVRAAYLGRRDDFERFIALAPHPFITDIFGRTAYAAALQGKHLSLASDIRERCFDPEDPRWPAGETAWMARVALSAAIECRATEHMEWLLARPGLPPSLPLNELLKKAVEARYADGARLLVASGANPRSLETELLARYGKLVENTAHPGLARGAQPATASDAYALRFPRLNRGRGTLFSPAPDNFHTARPPGEPLTAADRRLLSSAASGDLNGITSALAEGAMIDASDEKAWTPLIHALKQARIEAARLLVDRGASINWLTRHGSSPLGFALDLPDFSLARELLDLGADPNLVDPDRPGGSPLTTIMTKRPDAARLLLSRGADPRVIVNSLGRGGALPPVFIAAARGDLAGVKMLVAAGAEPAAVLWRDSSERGHMRGQTALHSAAASNDPATLDYFLALGLDPTQADAWGDNALDTALLKSADLTAAALRSRGAKTREERGLPPRD